MLDNIKLIILFQQFFVYFLQQLTLFWLSDPLRFSVAWNVIITSSSWLSPWSWELKSPLHQCTVGLTNPKLGAKSYFSLFQYHKNLILLPTPLSPLQARKSWTIVESFAKKTRPVLYSKLQRFLNLRYWSIGGETSYPVDYENIFYQIFFCVFACGKS
jgi:hypothetical protein